MVVGQAASKRGTESVHVKELRPHRTCTNINNNTMTGGSTAVSLWDVAMVASSHAKSRQQAMDRGEPSREGALRETTHAKNHTRDTYGGTPPLPTEMTH